MAAFLDISVYTNYHCRIYGDFAMTFYVRDPATDNAVRRLAKLKGKTLTETIREAVENELQREKRVSSLRERIKPIQDRLAAFAPTGLEADKAFYDALSGGI
jgi:antitoxin VapB